MQITLLRSHELTPRQVAAWGELQATVGAYRSPYFHPEFTRAVASTRDDVFVAVLEDGTGPVGFFPFQRGAHGEGRPVGGRLNDFHGVVLRPGVLVDADALLRAAGLSSFHFDHLVTSHQPFPSGEWKTGDSRWVNLADGFDAYRANRKPHTDQLVKTERKLRKLEREVGPVCLEWHTHDAEAWRLLLNWKSEQYRASGFTDVFSFPWTVELLRALERDRTAEFGGLFSVLRAGDRIIATHYGIQCRNVLHSWFPAYDRELSKHSPGLCLLFLLFAELPGRGITRFDFGKGDESYKVDFSTDAEPVAEGCHDCRPLARYARKAWHDTRAFVKSSPWLRSAAAIPLKLLRPLRDRKTFQ